MRKRSATVKKTAPPQATAETRPAGASGSAEPASKGKSVSAEEVRLLAYQKWEAAGRPGGDGANFWLEAEQELAQSQELTPAPLQGPQQQQAVKGV
jgi:hypothetical protein